MPKMSVRTLSWRGRTPRGKSASRDTATPDSSTMASKVASEVGVITTPSPPTTTRRRVLSGSPRWRRDPPDAASTRCRPRP